MVIVIALIVTAAAVGYTQERTATYTATAQLLVNPLPETDTTFLGMPVIRDTGDPTTTIQTAATLVDSPQAQQLTAARMGPGWTASRVRSQVSVLPQGQSDVLDITAQATTPKQATNLANTFANAVIDTRMATLQPLVARAIASAQSQLKSASPGSSTAAGVQSTLSELQGAAGGRDPTVSFSEAAVTPAGASGPSTALVIALAVLVGLLLGIGAALAIELLKSRRITEESELLRLLPAPVLARVPTLPRSFSRQGPALGAHLPQGALEAVRSLRIQLELLGRGSRSIMLTSASQGDGKTTMSIALARAFAEAGKRVILIDADFRKPDLGPALGVAPRVDVGELVEQGRPLSEALVNLPGLDSLSVLPAWGGTDTLVRTRNVTRLNVALHLALRMADYVIVDSAPLGEVADGLPLVRLVNALVLVSRLGNSRESSVKTVRDLLARVGTMPTGLLITSSPGRTSRYGYGYGYGYGRREADGHHVQEPVVEERPAAEDQPHEQPSQAG